ncbi:MAG: N-acetyltransferase [Clostridia bacterium]|nr:N-acetyltransferase [Clostridia bacterium]
MIIRQERTEDFDIIDQIHDKAFGHDWESKLIRNLRTEEGYDPTLSLVAEHDGQVVGHILFSRVTIESPVGSHPALILAPLAVFKKYRGIKAGTMLVSEGIRIAKERGETIMLVYGHRFYERFGFTLAHEKGIFRPNPIKGELVRILELEENAADGVMGVIKYPVSFRPLIEEWYK